MIINILAVGDVVGNSGLSLLTRKLGSIKKLKNIAFTVINGENAALLGITPAQAEELYAAGADVITLGNHSYNAKSILDFLDEKTYILRPANFAPQCPGRGCGIFSAPFGDVLVVNLIGRCDMDFGPDNPFLEIERILTQHSEKVILVDFHASATSEKLAMGYLLDGRVSALWGTHTHVQTSDARVFPKGTGYISDLGMCGPVESVLGIKPEQSISMFMGNPRQRYEAALGISKIECAIFEVDTDTGLCLSVEALRITE